MKNRIKLLRKDLKLTQKEFGDAIKVINSNISNIENGSVNLTDRNIYEICLVLCQYFRHKKSNFFMLHF